jgi:DNA-directed RNA polymerase specialized sigma24 family protein
VDEAFRRLWMRTIRNKALEFTTLAGALRFLHTCLNSAIIDTLRAYLRTEEMPWPESGFPNEPIAEDDYHSHEFWEAIKSLLPNPREQRLAYLLYFCGLKPRQIVQLFPDEFSDAQEVFRLTRNILDRLKRNKDRLRWLLGDEEL